MDLTHVVHSLLLLLYVLFFNGVTVVQSQETTQRQGDAVSNFEPSLLVVIGILLIMLFITFCLLIFVKFCRTPTDLDPVADGGAFITRSRRFSGIDKKLIDSLPFFRFSALKGSREGLECAVCLSKFEDVDILRLLPKCKHGFHTECIDNWLEHHSTCPLCRHKLVSDDLRVFNDSNLEMLIEREEEDEDGGIRSSSNHSSSTFGSSFRKIFFKSSAVNRDEKNNPITSKEISFHKYNHRIVMSDVVFQNRWSNVSSSDIMFLNNEMLGALSTDRLSHVEGGNPNPNADSTPSCSSEIVSLRSEEKRCQSEITGVSTFVQLNMKEGGNEKEERRRQLWFPIATRTVQWFAKREETSRKNGDSNKEKVEKDSNV